MRFDQCGLFVALLSVAVEILLSFLQRRKQLHSGSVTFSTVRVTGPGDDSIQSDEVRVACLFDQSRRKLWEKGGPTSCADYIENHAQSVDVCLPCSRRFRRWRHESWSANPCTSDFSWLNVSD